ncbi:ras-related protein Rab-33A [Patagioenas fasciata monilis]|uniref:small monomeric GTPase n=1 Tax=Patagioenas fasciata monilis TaxID=372326 RepID=A0A1V4KCH6_PATFA|nr:ras-related protein Rab-33A [Patagioenas fasciata monilis]
MKGCSSEKATRPTARLRSLCTNTRSSVGNKQEELEATVLLEGYDLVATAEPWWGGSRDWRVLIDVCGVFGRDGRGRKGGGVALYIRRRSECEELSLKNSHKQTRIFKIIVIGDSNVGKTCLTFRFCGGTFPDKTEATIGVDFREKTVEIEGERIKVQVWDTAGQERFRKSMVEHYYRNVHAVVFVYDVTKMTSFTNLKMWIEECNGHAVPALVPRVLVGNKCDLKDLIQVPSSMALKFADAHNMLLFETSAKDPKESQNVDAIFMCLACRLKAQRSLLCRDLEGRPGQARRLEPTQDANGKTSCPC